MSNFEEALIESTQWLTIPGVETIIPNQAEQTILVLVSSSDLLIKEFIPEIFRGFAVSFYCVHGLNVNGDYDDNLRHPLQTKESQS